MLRLENLAGFLVRADIALNFSFEHLLTNCADCEHFFRLLEVISLSLLELLPTSVYLCL